MRERLRAALPFGLALALFAAFLPTLHGVLSPYRDSGDLTAAAYSLGIAHPPGYALYALFTKAGMRVFALGNPGYRANFLSLLCAAAACGIVFQALRGFLSPGPILLALAVWAFSPSVAALARVSEMYALNACGCALLIWAVLSCRDAGGAVRGRRLLLAFFLVGLGFFNHPTIIFALPGLLLYAWLLFADGPRERGRAGLLIFACAALGFSLLLYYPIRSAREPWVDWGDAEGARNLWRLVTRADYGGLKLHPEESRFSWTARSAAAQVALFARAQSEELGWAGIALALAGLWAACKNFAALRLPALALCGVTFLIAGPAFFLFSNLPIGAETTLPILEPYLVMANLFALPFLALGAERILSPLPGVARAWSCVGAAALVVALQFPDSRRARFQAYDYGKNLFKTLPPGSVLYDPDDTTAFAAGYLQNAQGCRRDASVLLALRTRWGYRQLKERRPHLVPPGEFASAQAFIPALLALQLREGRPLFFDHPSKVPQGIESCSEGLLARAGRAADGPSARQVAWKFYVERRGSFAAIAGGERDFFERHLASRMSAALNNAGVELQGAKRFRAAEDFFRRAVRRQPGLGVAWNNLGANYYLQGDFPASENALRAGLERSGASDSLLYSLALAQKRQGKKGAAKASLQEVLRLRPDHAAARNELGLAYLDEADWGRARAEFGLCLRADPRFAAAHYNLGLALRALGLGREAADSFQRYLELAGGAEDAAQVRSWIARLRH